jgi:hypothetical protein
MRRTGNLERRTPLAAESAKVRARKGERARTKTDALARDGGCIAARLVPDVACRGPLDAHERLPRSRGGSPYDLENVLTVCRAHHEWIHAHPARSKPLDLLA